MFTWVSLALRRVDHSELSTRRSERKSQSAHQKRDWKCRLLYPVNWRKSRQKICLYLRRHLEIILSGPRCAWHDFIVQSQETDVCLLVKWADTAYCPCGVLACFIVCVCWIHLRKAKRQYLLTCKVSRYCILALQKKYCTFSRKRATIQYPGTGGVGVGGVVLVWLTHYSFQLDSGVR